MKLKSIYIAAIGLLLAGCLKPVEEKEPELFMIKVSTATLTALDTELKVSVECDVKWTAELEDPSWGVIEILDEQKGRGGSFRISCDPNMTDKGRDNTVIVKAGSKQLSKKFKQNGINKFFSTNSVTLGTSGEVEITFTAPCDWTAEAVGNPEWLILSATSGKKGSASLTCSPADENENVGSRSTSIRFTFGDTQLDIPVFQDQKDVIRLLGDTKLTYNYEARTITVQTQFNVDYEVESVISWVTHKTTKAPLNQREEVFELEENPTDRTRIALIRFTSSSLKPVDLTIVQEGKDAALMVSQPGFYGIQGEDYIYGEGGWNQQSRLCSPDSTFRYRFFNANSMSMVELAGIHFTEVGDESELRLTVRSKESRRPAKSCTVTLIHSENGLYWFKEDDKTFYIVRKEDAQ